VEAKRSVGVVNLERWLSQRRPEWEELEDAVARASGRAERLGPDGVRRLGALYRAAAADLALARRKFPVDPVVGRLEDLVSRARHLVYDTPAARGSLAGFFASTYWRRVAERPFALALAAVLLFAPAALAAGWALDDPGAAAGLVPAQFRTVTEPRPGGSDLGLSPGQQAAFAGQIFTNNIRVTFVAFAGGIALGLGTAAALVYNGVVLGTIGGLAAGAGGTRGFVELVIAHGVLELSCIVVSAAAGLRMGWALVVPGRRRRSDALVAEGRRAVQIVLGTAPWLVLAGVVEGFVTPRGLGVLPATTVGVTLGACFWGLTLWRGPRQASRTETARPAP
jgi:uncharacterized membrane protein SpoIIM required for sporulation